MITQTPNQTPSAEEESLKLVEDFDGELRHALDSLGDVWPNTLLDTYRFWSSKHLQRALAGFAFLRQSGLVDSSKFLVRPAIEMFIRLEAGGKHPDLFYRIASSERRRDEQLLREADKLSNNEAQSKENWKRFKEKWQRFDDAFTAEFPNIPKSNEELYIASAAEKAGLKPFYGSHYRIYSQYTHGALRASSGTLDQATDPEDNRIMAICALGALDTLVSLGAKSPNHGDLVERLQHLGNARLRKPNENGC
jgi:hypothetical protein